MLEDPRVVKSDRGGRVGLRTGEKFIVQTVKSITKRVLNDAKRERFKTNGGVFPIIGMSFQEV